MFIDPISQAHADGSDCQMDPQKNALSTRRLSFLRMLMLR
jgi:hypothetical protein